MTPAEIKERISSFAKNASTSAAGTGISPPASLHASL